MIVETIDRDISKKQPKNIAFPINVEGYNDNSFILSWPELKDFGQHKMGEVFSKRIGGITLYAMVCYSLKYGWPENQTEVIEKCFNNIKTEDKVYSYVYGVSHTDSILGANIEEILLGMNNSTKNIVLKTNYSLNSILKLCDNYNKEGSKQI